MTVGSTSMNRTRSIDCPVAAEPVAPRSGSSRWDGARDPDPERRFLFEAVPWWVYLALRDALEQTGVRMTYLPGRKARADESIGSARGGEEDSFRLRPVIAKREARRKRRARRRVTCIGLAGTREMLGAIFEDVHAKRLDSLANYSVGVMQSTRSAVHAVHAVGAAYAELATIKRSMSECEVSS
jgi:hypothetical protein